MKRWTTLCVGLMLGSVLLCFAACSSDEAESKGAELSASDDSTVSSEQESAPVGSVIGSYVSAEGDGEILQLFADGTFLSYTIIDLDCAVGTVSMTESITGRYSKNEKGNCVLKIEEISLKAQGLENDPEEIAAYAALMAGDDEVQLALYTRMFGGEVITGLELYGEEDFAMLTSKESIAVLDFENLTFSFETSE